MYSNSKRKHKNKDLLLSLLAVRASPPVLQSNHRSIILYKIFLLLHQCMVQLARPVASLGLVVLPSQQSGHRGLNPWVIPAPSYIPPLAGFVTLPGGLAVSHPGGTAAPQRCVVCGAMANPARPLAARPCGYWCIYSKSCKLSVVSAPSLNSRDDKAPLMLTGWPCRRLDAHMLGVPPAP